MNLKRNSSIPTKIEDSLYGIIQPVHQKSDKLLYTNYGSFTVVNVTYYKVLPGFINDKLSKYLVQV